MELPYRFDDATYVTLGAAGVDWRAALYVLTQAHPRVRHHIGGVLRVAGETPDGRWLAVALIEEADDAYLVVGARWLDPDEAALLGRLVERGRS